MQINSIRPARGGGLGYVFLGALAMLATQLAHGLDTQRVYRLAGLAGVPRVTDVPFRVVTEAYRHLGLQVEIVPLPHARSLLSANDGTYDGNLPRFTYIEASAPNLRRVPASLGKLEYVPYVLGSTVVNLSSWEDIRASGLRVGGKLGNRMVEASLGNALTSRNKDYLPLLKMLLVQRLDVVIAPRGELEAQFASVPPKLAGRLGEVRSLQVLATEQLYLYLHQHNSDLIEPLTNELKRMEANGTIGKYWKAQHQRQ